jgi:hypothetical protein
LQIADFKFAICNLQLNELMPLIDPAYWTAHLRATLERYGAALVRQVAAALFKPRSQWPIEELIERCVATIGNAAVIDRRLQDLDPSGRKLLALIGHSRQPRWRLGHLLGMLAALGHARGTEPIAALFEAGLLYPDLGADHASAVPVALSNAGRLESFAHWLGQSSALHFTVFAPPQVTARALGVDLGLPECPGVALGSSSIHEADGLEWPLRMAVLWQQVAAAPLRRTQQGDFFKRDLDRLREDPLLSGPPADNLADMPDTGLLAVALAEIEGVVTAGETELRAGTLPAGWDHSLYDTLASLWAALPYLQAWDPRDGWNVERSVDKPYSSAYLLVLLFLAGLQEGRWARPADVEEWLRAHHPYWTGESARPSARRPWVATFLLGLAYQLRLVHALKDPDGDWLVRLSPLGLWLLGLAEAPAAPPPYAQTLLVQPNLELIAYRQGLTPQLIGRLGRFAAWKSLGAACTLQLEPETVYRALESGLTFDDILRTLEQHGMRQTSTAVVNSLRTWADKRERLSVYPAAALFEFASAEDLNEALARGLPGVRISDRLAVVHRESDIDYRHFRLTGTRDYGLPPERCVEIEGDGVTLAVDLTRSDLLLETELQRFAEPLPDGAPGVSTRRRYRLTPATLAGGRDGGVSVRALDEWFLQRAGQPLSPAARLLLTGSLAPPVELKRQLVLHVATPEVADGLMQWPGTRAFIEGRLGPTALAVAEEHVDELRQRLGALGVCVQSV